MRHRVGVILCLTVYRPLLILGANPFMSHYHSSNNFRYLCPTISRPICLIICRSPGAHDQILIIVAYLRFYSWGVPSLTRGQVSNLVVQLLLILASDNTIGPKSRKNRDHMLTPYFIMRSLLQLVTVQWNYSNTYPHVKVKIIFDRGSVGQSILLSDHHLGNATNFSLFHGYYFRHLLFLVCGNLSNERTSL